MSGNNRRKLNRGLDARELSMARFTAARSYVAWPPTSDGMTQNVHLKLQPREASTR